MYLRLKTKYQGSDWIFMKEAIVLFDKQKHTFSLGETNRKTLSSGVKETSDISIDDELLQIIQKFAISQGEVRLRLSGERNKDVSYSKREKRNLVSIIRLYKELKNSIK